MGKSLNRIPLIIGAFACLALACICLPATARAGNAPAVHVLCYHAFLENEKTYSFSLEETEKHINYFIQQGFRFLSLRDVLRGNYRGTKNILVTIDDGNRSVFQAYHRVFKKHGIKPLLAIYPSIIGKKEYALAWKELKELHDEGCPVASHGYYHQYVNQKLYDSNRASFMREIYQSKALLEKELDAVVDIFVYPYGVHSPITVETLKQAGYRYAFAIQGGHLGPEHVLQGTLKLPRYLLTRANAGGLLAYIARDARRLEEAVPAAVADKSRPAKKEKKPARPAAVREKAFLPVMYPPVQVAKTVFVKAGAKDEKGGEIHPPVAAPPVGIKPSAELSSFFYGSTMGDTGGSLPVRSFSDFKKTLDQCYMNLMRQAMKSYLRSMKSVSERIIALKKTLANRLRDMREKRF